jgi:hypothetical protein
MYATTLGVDGGRLDSPYGATIIVPRNCLPDQSTVMIRPVEDLSVPSVSGIDTVPGTAFDVSFGGPDGRAVENLNSPAILTIALKSALSSQDAHIYRVEENTLQVMPDTEANAGSVSTEFRSRSRFVVGVSEGNVAATASGFNPFVIGGLGLVALASAGLLISRGLQRRKPRLIPARRPVTNRVRYR